MTELEKLIADSITRAEAAEALRKEKEGEEEGEYQSLLADATDRSLTELGEQIPRALIAYCEATHEPSGDRDYKIKTLREGWRPERFKVDAPGLATIYFTVDRQWNNEDKEWKEPYIKTLSTSGQYSDDHRKWFLAIAEAARLREQNEKWEREQNEWREQEARRPETPKPPTPTEQLETAIRRVVRDEMARDGEF